MDPIQILHPPPEAFNKNRRISDLIRAQVNHLKHLEQKLSAGQRLAIPQHGITTENEAAKYIAAMTTLLLARPAAKSSPGPGIRLVGQRRASSLKPAEGLAIAASEDAQPASSAPANAAPGPASKKAGPAPKEKK